MVTGTDAMMARLHFGRTGRALRADFEAVGDIDWSFLRMNADQ